MPKTITLNPRWKPAELPAGTTSYGGDWFVPCVVEEHGVVIVGGPGALHVLQTFQRQRLWFSIIARVAISGFAVNGSTIYVQDGPVLSSWDLSTATQVGDHVEGLRLAAINLATFARWVADQAPASEEQLAALHQVPAPIAELQARRREVARREAWTRLRADACALAGGAPAPLLGYIDRAIGTPAPNDSASLAPATYSAPAVRLRQVGAAQGGLVFVIAADGLFHALDGDLNHLSRQGLDAPARPELTLVERPIPGDSTGFSCHLYYAIAAGGIRCIDASVSPPSAREGWPGPALATPPPPGAIALHGDLLWVREVLGPGLVATPLDPTAHAVFSESAAGESWSSWDVEPALGFVLRNGPTRSKLIAYPPGSPTRDRWPEVAHPPGWMRFVRSTPLVLHLDREASSSGDNVGFAVRGANLVGAPHPIFRLEYPPAPAVHVTGALDPGAAAPRLPRIGVVRTAPVLEQRRLFCVAGPAPIARQLAAWISPRPDGPGASEQFMAAHPDPTAVFPPSSLAPDFLVGFLLDRLIDAALPEAEAELGRNQALVTGIVVPVFAGESDTPPERMRPVGSARHLQLILIDPAGAETQLSSDAGIAIGNQLVFDLRFAGHVLQAPRRRWHPRWARARRWMVEETNRVTLRPGMNDRLELRTHVE